MSGKFQIIRIDNLIVRKTDMLIGENIIGNDAETRAEDEPIVEQAVKIYLSPDGEMSITPNEEISCYIKSYGSLHWKLLTPNWTVPLRIRDTCLLFPIKIWFRIIPAMDEENQTRSPKRKLEEIVEDEPPNKRRCAEVYGKVDPSQYNLNNNCGVLDLVKAVGADNIEKNEDGNNLNDNDANDSNSEQCSNIDKNEKEQELEFSSTNQSNESLNADLNKEVNGDACEETKQDDEQSYDQKNTDVEEDKNPEVNATNSNGTDQTNQIASKSTQILSREKCKYGSQCYRRNDEHKTKFSHPEDSDYDVPDNRPKCPYGLKCYRKNTQHKLDYKHTRSKRKAAMKATQPRPAQDISDLEDSIDEFEESVDESDYDGSFIDDDDLEQFESDFEDDENE